MRYNLSILFIFCSFLVNAQVGFKELAGKWQEQQRDVKKDIPVAFMDTMRIEFRPEGFMMLRFDIGPTIFGEAEIKGKYIKIKERQYQIQEVNENNLTIIEDTAIHYFKRVIEFGSSPVTKVVPGKEIGEVKLDTTVMKGKWTCYKKTDNQYNGEKFYLKSFTITEDKGNGNYIGSAAFSKQDSIYTIEAFIYIKPNNSIIISTDEDSFKAKILKSNGQEMILEHNTITYYLKQFGKKE